MSRVCSACTRSSRSAPVVAGDHAGLRGPVPGAQRIRRVCLVHWRVGQAREEISSPQVRSHETEHGEESASERPLSYRSDAWAVDADAAV